MISNLLFASLTLVAQQWWTNPTVHNVQGNFSTDEQSCFLQMIRSQDKLMANEPNVDLLLLNISTPISSIIGSLELLYGSSDENGYAKQTSEIIITTSSPNGWVAVGKDDTGYAFKAADMGRFANVMDAKTDVIEFQMDLTPCQQFFGITNQ